MNTRLCFLSALLLITILTGCSLTPNGSSGESAGLRLLQTGGGTTSLSSASFDDWSPQMVSWNTTNYLYFLSTREFTGRAYSNATWVNNYTKTTNTVGIFRAQMESPGVFKNLELFYHLPAGEHFREITVISNGNMGEPTIYAYYQNSFASNVMVISLPPVGGSLIFSNYQPTGPESIALGGSWTTAGGNVRVFIGNRISRSTNYLSKTFGYNAITFYATPVDFHTPQGEAILQIKPDYNPEDFTSIIPETQGLLQNFLQERLQARYNDNIRTFQGVGPAVFEVPGTTNKRFGFFISVDGILHQMVYRECVDYPAFTYTTDSGLSRIIDSPDLLDKQRLIPLIAVTHIPGSVDKNPSFHPGSGLYFSSDRAPNGKFDLYYVPRQYLAIPAEILLPAAIINPR